MTDTASSSRTDSISAGAPADEIEITPEMIAAGVSALCAYEPEFDFKEEGVDRIFRAMLAASIKKWVVTGVSGFELVAKMQR